MRYWDSAALVPLVVQEAETEQREQLPRHDRHLVGELGQSMSIGSGSSRIFRRALKTSTAC